MPFRYVKNIVAAQEQLARLNIWNVADAGLPVNGTSGSGAGMLGPGSYYTDTNTGYNYVNVGTLLSPVWSLTDAPVAGLQGLGVIGNAKMTYDFAVNGGAVSTITPTDSPTIPLGAIILGGVIDITTTLTSGGAATIALGLGSGAQIASLKAATAVATYAAGLTVPIIEVFTAATYYKVTAAAQMTATIAAFALTAGRMDVNIVYVVGN